MLDDFLDVLSVLIWVIAILVVVALGVIGMGCLVLLIPSLIAYKSAWYILLYIPAIPIYALVLWAIAALCDNF